MYAVKNVKRLVKNLLGIDATPSTPGTPELLRGSHQMNEFYENTLKELKTDNRNDIEQIEKYQERIRALNKQVSDRSIVLNHLEKLSEAHNNG